MGAGLAGSSVYGANVNQIQFGDRLQGLSPKATQFFIQSGRGGGNNYRALTAAPKRDFIFCMNQLSGVGASRSPYKIRGLNNPRGTGHCRPGRYYPAGYRVSEAEMRAHGSMNDPRLEFWLVYGGIVYSTGTSSDPFWVAHGSSLSSMPSSIDQTDIYASGVVSAEDLLAAIMAPGSHGMSGGAYAKMLADLAVIGTYDGALAAMPSMPGSSAIVTKKAEFGDADFMFADEEIALLMKNPNTDATIISAIDEIREYFTEKYPEFMDEHMMILVGDEETIAEDLHGSADLEAAKDRHADSHTHHKAKAELVRDKFLHLHAITDKLRSKGATNAKYQALVEDMEAGDTESARILGLVNMVNYHSSQDGCRPDSNLYQYFNISKPEMGYFNGLNAHVGRHRMGFLKHAEVRDTLRSEEYGLETWYGLEVYCNTLIASFGLLGYTWKFKVCTSCNMTGDKKYGMIFLKRCNNNADWCRNEKYFDSTFKYLLSYNWTYEFAVECACAVAMSYIVRYVVNPILAIINNLIDDINNVFAGIYTINKNDVRNYIISYISEAIGCS